MGRVLRFDRAPFGHAEKTPEGYLRVRDQKVARIGVQEYTTADGDVQRELRLPEDVFDFAALMSGENQPIVDLHPTDGRVTSMNYKGLSCGTMSMLRSDETGTFVVADILIQDQTLIGKVESGEQVELSLGYDTISIPVEGGEWRQPGHVLDGAKADVRQTSIKINHLAVVPEARANQGLTARPVRVRLDADGNQSAADSRLLDLSPQVNQTRAVVVPGVKKKMKFKLPGGGTVEVDDSIGAALNSQRADVDNLTGMVKDMADSVKAMSARIDEAMKPKDKPETDEDMPPKKKDGKNKDGKNKGDDEEENEDEDEDKNKPNKRGDSAQAVVARYRLMRDAESAGIDLEKAAGMSELNVRLAVLKHRGVKVPADRVDDDSYVAAICDFSASDATASNRSGANESEIALFPAAAARADAFGESPYLEAFKKKYG
ncbi:MAG: DUF2213 domain-containing protein [Myxococcota bacterium]